MFILRKRIVFDPRIGIVSMLLLFGISCTKSPELEKVSDVEIIRVIDSTLNMSFICHLHNSNMVSLSIQNSDFTVSYDNTKIGKFSFEEEVELESGTSTKVMVDANINLKGIGDEYISMLENDSVPFEMRGDVDYKVLGFSGKSAMEKDFFINIRAVVAEQIDEKLKNSNAMGLMDLRFGDDSNINHLILESDFEIINPQAIDFTIERLDLQVSLKEGKPKVASWVHNQPLFIKAYDTVSVPVSLKLNNGEILSQLNVFELAKNNTPITVNGKAGLSINNYYFDVPVSYSKKVDLSGVF